MKMELSRPEGVWRPSRCCRRSSVMCDEEPEPGGAGWASAPGAPAVTAGHATCILLPGPRPALLSFRPVLSPALRCPVTGHY